MTRSLSCSQAAFESVQCHRPSSWRKAAPTRLSVLVHTFHPFISICFLLLVSLWFLFKPNSKVRLFLTFPPSWVEPDSWRPEWRLTGRSWWQTHISFSVPSLSFPFVFIFLILSTITRELMRCTGAELPVKSDSSMQKTGSWFLYEAVGFYSSLSSSTSSLGVSLWGSLKSFTSPILWVLSSHKLSSGVFLLWSISVSYVLRQTSSLAWFSCFFFLLGPSVHQTGDCYLKSTTKISAALLKLGLSYSNTAVRWSLNQE